MKPYFYAVRKIAQYAFVGIVTVALNSCSTFTPDDESSHASYSMSEPFVLGYGVAEEGAFEMFAVNGSVEIIGVEGATSIDIWGKRIVKAESREDASAHINDIEFNIHQGRYNLMFETIMPTAFSGREYEVEYHVRVPMAWDVSIYHKNGRIDARSITSALSIDLSNGEVVFDSIDGDVSTHVENGIISGDIQMNCGNTCKLGITNGRIDLYIPEDLSAILTANVITGTVDVSELSVEDLNDSADGFCGCLGDGDKTVDLSAVNGTIRVRCR